MNRVEKDAVAGLLAASKRALLLLELLIERVHGSSVMGDYETVTRLKNAIAVMESVQTGGR